MPQEEKNIIIEGDKVKEVSTTEKVFDKAEYLAQKQAELQAHDEGVQAYNESQSKIRAELVKTIEELEK